jgi:hypothetical protein
MRWSDLETRQPRLARRARERLVDPGVVLVVSIRSDGTPRLSPVEPFLLHGGLWLSMMWGSLKARDLLRDPRVLVHGIVTEQAYADAVAAALGWRPEVGRFHLFEVDVGQVSSVRYASSGDQHVTVWPPGREFVRRLTSATSVGEPEEGVDLLVS